jgi:hypothetical protein
VADRRKQLVVAGGSVLLTGLLLALALSLGGWAYRHRRYTLHDGRLRRLVLQHPSADRVSRGILDEAGSWAIPTPDRDDELRALAERWSKGRADEVVTKRRQWTDTRIFGVRDVAYVLYFDAEGKLRDYVLLTEAP